ncbi:unnamed protein product [Adineta steineri]|uniref:Bcl-2 Bcl-2 homology region 1-3 domain-containing protein n=2 Tax=Adineta steineri TaxID=433720 RepID=A0A819C6Z5_9BILA|nr:unnamed protein product [Adineta steineri]
MSTNDNPTTTRLIVTDYFNWRLRNLPIRNNRLLIIVQKIASDCETSYYSQQPMFNFHFASLSLFELRSFHYETVNEFFNDGIVTWGRVITFIVFSAILTERVIQQQQHNRDLIISSMIDWTTNFLDIDLHLWFESQNYWDGCLKIYDKNPQRRNSYSRVVSILTTIGMLTLGALYIKRI